jgi:hypothetical protein
MKVQNAEDLGIATASSPARHFYRRAMVVTVL